MAPLQEVAAAGGAQPKRVSRLLDDLSAVRENLLGQLRDQLLLVGRGQRSKDLRSVNHHALEDLRRRRLRRVSRMCASAGVRRVRKAGRRGARELGATFRLKLCAMSSVSGPSCSRKLSRESLSMTVFPTATTFALRTASFAEGSRQDSPACARAGCVAGETTRAAAARAASAGTLGAGWWRARRAAARGVRRRAAAARRRRRPS